MSPVSAWPERLVATAPSVTKKAGGDGIVLSLAGAWIVGAGKALETGATSLMKEVGDAKTVILDFTQVPYVDSAGVGAIVNAHVSCVNSGRRLLLVAVPDRIRTLMRVTRVEQILSFFPTVEEAQASTK